MAPRDERRRPCPALRLAPGTCRTGAACLLQHHRPVGPQRRAGARAAGQPRSLDLLPLEARPRRRAAPGRARTHQLFAGHLQGAADAVPRAGAGRCLGEEAQPGSAVRRPQRAGADARRPGRGPVRGTPVPGRAARLGVSAIPRRKVSWRPSYRIVSSRFPPVGLFDRIASAEDLDAVFEIESLTNPRLREEWGELSLVPPARRISGPGTTPVMAAFTHANPDGSRFSDGTYGVYYAARERVTAIAETIHHRQRFLRATDEPATVLQMRCYLADLTGRLHDIRGGWPELHDPDSYAASQAAARELRRAGSDGMVYDSVRRRGGQCVAAF